MKLKIRNFLVKIFRLLGRNVYDVRSGEKLGRAFFFPWGGGVRVIGCEASWVPVPVAQSRITYWRQDIGFTRHDPAPTRRSDGVTELLRASEWRDAAALPLLVVLDHRSPEAVSRNLQSWEAHGFSAAQIVLAYGGTREHFEQIDREQKIYIEDPKLRTRDHQRERQSYGEIFEAVSHWLEGKAFTHVLFMEFDQIPVAQDVPGAYLAKMAEHDADVMGYMVHRIDGTLHPHWLGIAKEVYQPDPVWSMLGTGHFWKREAWEAVSGAGLYPDWYLELGMASSVVALGYRLCPCPGQERFVQAIPSRLPCSPTEAHGLGAWTLHPVKSPTLSRD